MSAIEPPRRVGVVVRVWRYPVKSMAAEELAEAEVGWHGLSGDRRWAFVRPGLERSGFPWLTIRELPEMRDYRPRFERPDRPDDSATVVATPSGDELDVVDPGLARRLGEGVRVIKQDVGVFDVMPLSLITVQTIASLERLSERPLVVQRFRPNLLVDADGGDFPEDAWVGATIQIGESVRVRIDQRDKRCVMVNVDPTTSVRDPSVLRTIARHRQACAGAYGTTVRPGHLAVGDPVSLLPGV